MYLNEEEQSERDERRDLIVRNLAKHIEYNHAKCKDCYGTGLKRVAVSEGSGVIADPTEFCDTCDGVGYVDWKDSDNYRVCRKCHGSGYDERWKKCKQCDGLGILDFIKIMMGKG